MTHFYKFHVIANSNLPLRDLIDVYVFTGKFKTTTIFSEIEFVIKCRQSTYLIPIL